MSRKTSLLIDNHIFNNTSNAKTIFKKISDVNMIQYITEIYTNSLFNLHNLITQLTAYQVIIFI